MDLYASPIWNLSFLAVLDADRLNIYALLCQFILMGAVSAAAYRNMKFHSAPRASSAPTSAPSGTPPSGIPLPNHAESVLGFNDFSTSAGDLEADAVSRPQD